MTLLNLHYFLLKLSFIKNEFSWKYFVPFSNTKNAQKFTQVLKSDIMFKSMNLRQIVMKISLAIFMDLR